MPKRYMKEFKGTILELYNQGKSAHQLSLEYEVGYSTILKWVQGATTSPGGLTPDEAKALRKQLKEKDEGLLILKKSTRPASEEIEIIAFIRQESEAGHHSVSKMCRLLDDVSRAVYYRKINPTLSKRASERALLDRRVLRVYHESGRVYGAGKIRYLLAQNYSEYRKISIKRIQRSM